MLFRFEPSDISFKKVKISNLSYSFGGTLTILDEDRLTPRHDVYKRYSIPLALVRVFKDTYKINKFLIPVEGCIMLYRGNVIAIEKNRLNERFYLDHNNELREWQPTMEATYKKIKMMTYVGSWYFDGSYVYTFGKDHITAINEGELLSVDGCFRSVLVNAIRITYVGYNEDVYSESRQCLAYVAKNGLCSISPPIWKNMGGVGGTKMKKKLAQSELTGLITQFDKVDAIMAVNLNFALQAGNVLTKQFGYKSIEPLQLPKLMIQLKTVNLPRISQEIKQTFDIGLTFTQAMSWLLGMQMQITEYDQMIAIRKLFKYLSVTGIYARKSISDIRIDNTVSVPLLTRAQAEANAITYLTPQERLTNILTVISTNQLAA